MKYLLLFENFEVNESNAYSDGEFRDVIVMGLANYLRPVEIDHIMKFYDSDMEESFNNGESPKDFLAMLIAKLGCDKVGNLLNINLPKQEIVNITYY